MMKKLFSLLLVSLIFTVYVSQEGQCEILSDGGNMTRMSIIETEEAKI